jgi:hypothetical protein
MLPRTTFPRQLGDIRGVPTPILWPPTKGGGGGGNNPVTIDDTMRNLVINGDMRVDQRNEGNGKTVNSAAITRSVDKFWGFGVAAAGIFGMTRVTAGTPPPGFTAYVRNSVATADAAPAAGSVYEFATTIEAFLIQKTNFGTANANALSLSFWVRSSLTGTFSGALRNAASTRTYAFTFSVAVANTWTQILLAIPGDTAGTWVLSGNGPGITLDFNLGCGSTSLTATANAWQTGAFLGVTGTVGIMATISSTLDITGVQLEVNPSVTAFDYVRYEIQLAECQRYYEKSFSQGTVPAQNIGQNTGELIIIASTAGVTTQNAYTEYKVTKRTAPTLTTFNPAAANAQIRDESIGADCSSTGITSLTDASFLLQAAGPAGTVIGNILGVHWTADADI